MKNDFMLPYKMACKIQQQKERVFAYDDFLTIVEAFQAAGGTKAQTAMFDFYSKLSNEEIVSRCKKICRLNSLLTKVKINSNDLSRK